MAGIQVDSLMEIVTQYNLEGNKWGYRVRFLANILGGKIIVPLNYYCSFHSKNCCKFFDKALFACYRVQKRNFMLKHIFTQDNTPSHFAKLIITHLTKKSFKDKSFNRMDTSLFRYLSNRNHVIHHWKICIWEIKQYLRYLGSNENCFK